MPVLNILRGPSGSGKSTFLKNSDAFQYKHIVTGEPVPYDSVTLLEKNKLVFQENICSSDFYHFAIDTKLDEPFYDFKIERISETHNLCFAKFLNCIKNKLEIIYVDNTNIKKWQYENYITVAQMHGYVVNIFEFEVKTVEEIRLLIQRNQHGVSDSIVARMAIDFETDERSEKISIKC